MRAPRQQRIRATHRQQQAVAAQAREARHGGGTSFPMVDMLVYDDSDDEGHDDDSDVDESRSSTSDDSDTDARGNLRDFAIVIHYFFSPFPRVHLAVWHGAIRSGHRLNFACAMAKATILAGSWQDPGRILLVRCNHFKKTNFRDRQRTLTLGQPRHST